MAVVTAWAWEVAIEHPWMSARGEVLWFWPLAALIVPHVYQSLRQDRFSFRSTNLSWVASVCLTIALGLVTLHANTGLWVIVYSSWFAALYLAGARWLRDGATLWQRSFQSAGALGIAVTGLVFTFSGFWRDMSRFYQSFWDIFPEARWIIRANLAVAGGMFLCVLLLLTVALRRRERTALVAGALPILAAFLYFLARRGWIEPLWPAVVFNLYVLAIGVGAVAIGIRAGRLGTVNLGMALFAVLVVARFFDTHMSFVTRGVAFIAVGAGFLATNTILLRRKGGAK
jgi:hypothetical protein